MKTDIDALYKAAEIEEAISDPRTAHLVIDKDQVAGANEVEGLRVDPTPIEDGVEVAITVEEGAVIEKPVHMCFGVTELEGLQKINLNLRLEPRSKVGILAHCVFPQARDVRHVMDAEIDIGQGADYSYLEKHVHSPSGGIKVVSRAQVNLAEKARFHTDFELIKGRVGDLEIDYDTRCERESVMEMTAKVNGSGDDRIKIDEKGQLLGEGARGVLNTRVAVRERSKAQVNNELIATAAGARGHVDCKEIIQDEGEANAVPIVTVKHPEAHVTHEAALGSVDEKQLDTLMARGLEEEEAVDLIIEGLLS